MDTTQPHTVNLTGVLSMSKKIILSSRTHFLTLSLFFLPLSFFLITSLRLPDLHFTGYLSKHRRHQNHHLSFALTIDVLTLCAICTITYTTHQSFLGSPVKISDALKSLTTSFIHLSLTAKLALVLIGLIAQSFLLLVQTLLKLLHNLGFVINHNSTYFMWFSGIACVIMIAIIVYFYVEWSLAFVVVVAESKCGFAPLMRSSNLVKGMRSVSLLLMFYFGVLGAVIVWICSKYRNVPGIGPFNVMFGLICMMLILLSVTAANTSLYNMALHGESVNEVADGVDHEYMSLPVDDVIVAF